MYRSLSGRENENSGSKKLELGLSGVLIHQLETNMAQFLFEVRNPLIEHSVCDLLVLDFGSETFRSNTSIKITPIGYIFIKLVLLVYLFGSFLYE